MKWWIVIISLVVVLLAGGGATAFLLLADGNEEAGQTTDETAAKSDGGDEASKPVQPAVYQAIKPPIIVNFKENSGGPRYLQVGIEIMSRDQRVIDAINKNMPAIRNDLILLLSDQDPEALHGREGKAKLRKSLRTAIQKVVNTETPALAQDGNGGADNGDDAASSQGAAVEAVYFTKFVMQ